MNLSPPIALEHHINASQGYLDLGMPGEALAELDRIPAAERSHPVVERMRIHILMHSRCWHEALNACESLRATRPESTLGYIQGAFCLHELGRTSEAMKLLMDGPASLLRDPVYFYNLGCYHAVLGRREEAENYLRMSFNMDERFREFARHDPDLAGVLEKP